eukprot:SAG11_NODE_4327_length_1946_cov_2.250135_3_plen_125_part_00
MFLCERGFGEGGALKTGFESCKLPRLFTPAVNTDEVTDYLTIIKDPIDLQLIERRLKQPNLFYKTKEIFKADLKRMVDNCRTFNEQVRTLLQMLSVQPPPPTRLSTHSATGRTHASLLPFVIGY